MIQLRRHFGYVRHARGACSVGTVAFWIEYCARIVRTANGARALEAWIALQA
jgi:hypothetical protein